MKKDFDILEKIQTVDAPPFLFTRIQSHIEKQLKAHVTKKQAVVYLAGICLVVGLNILALTNQNSTTRSSDLVSELNLSPSNQLY